MSKTEVRALAREMGLAVAEKQESYEICFVPNGDYAAFLDAYLRVEGRRTAWRRRVAKSSPPTAVRSASMPACIISRWASGAGWVSRPASRSM